MHKIADVKGELNDLFRALGPLMVIANDLVLMGNSLDLSNEEKAEIRSRKNEIEEWQKQLNKINGDLNKLSLPPDSKKRINCYLTYYYSASSGDLPEPLSGAERGTAGPMSGGVEQAGDGLAGSDTLQQNLQMRTHEMETEYRQFNTLSNAMKNRHASAMADIRNIQ